MSKHNPCEAITGNTIIFYNITFNFSRNAYSFIVYTIYFHPLLVCLILFIGLSFESRTCHIARIGAQNILVGALHIQQHDCVRFALHSKALKTVRAVVHYVSYKYVDKNLKRLWRISSQKAGVLKQCHLCFSLL